MPVFGFGSEYWMWATFSHGGECTNLGRSSGFIWGQITTSYHQIAIFLDILFMIQEEFDSVWTFCWMEGFALPPCVGRAINRVLVFVQFSKTSKVGSGAKQQSNGSNDQRQHKQ